MKSKCNVGSLIGSWIRQDKWVKVSKIQIRSEVNNIISMLIFWFRKLYYDYIRWDGNIKEREMKDKWELWWTIKWTHFATFSKSIILQNNDDYKMKYFYLKYLNPTETRSVSLAICFPWFLVSLYCFSMSCDFWCNASVDKKLTPEDVIFFQWQLIFQQANVVAGDPLAAVPSGQ